MNCSKTSWLTAWVTLDLKKHSGPRQKMKWHPKSSLNVKTSHWTSSILDSVPLHSSFRLWDLDFLMKCKVYFHLKRRLWTTEQLIFRNPLRLSLIQEWLYTRYVTVVVAHVLGTCVWWLLMHCLSPLLVKLTHIFKSLCLTILSGQWLSMFLVHFFLPHFLLPLNFLRICLDTALCEQPASLAMASAKPSGQQSSP